MADVAKDGLPALFQIVANVALFVPLGFIAGRLLRMRLVTLVLFFILPLIVVPVLLIFYAVKRQMPYDLLPASAVPAAAGSA